MASTTYSGALQPKKKAELQEIADALGLSDDGTKEELQTKIKKHLDRNQAQLEEMPEFAGLYGRRRRGGSAQPQQRASTRTSPDASPDRRPSRKTTKALEAIGESTPNANDLNEVSSMMKNPFAPRESSPAVRHLGTPSSLPPLPDSPNRSILDVVTGQDMESIVQSVKSTERSLVRSSQQLLIWLRSTLSDSTMLFFVTAALELLFILYTATPWQKAEVARSYNVVYPASGTWSSRSYWSTLTHWAVPTVLLPSIIGTLISFKPSTDTSRAATPTWWFDALTASILRLAAHIVYPYPQLDMQITGIDVLGYRWRVLSASVTLAFAFAEVIKGAPVAATQTRPRSASTGGSFTGRMIEAAGRNGQRLLMAEETSVEVD